MLRGHGTEAAAEGIRVPGRTNERFRVSRLNFLRNMLDLSYE